MKAKLSSGEEELVGGIGEAQLLVRICVVAAGGRGFAALRLKALDGSDAGERALAPE